MTLPPWLWRLFRSRKLRRVLFIGVWLGLVAAAAFYPVANWWGRQRMERVMADLEHRGYELPSRRVLARELPGCLFSHPAFLAESRVDHLNRLGASGRDGGPQGRTFGIGLGSEGAAALANWTSYSTFEDRRRALVEAVRWTTRLDQVEGTRVIISAEEAFQALHHVDFLKGHGVAARDVGKHEVAHEDAATAFRILADLRGGDLILELKRELPVTTGSLIQNLLTASGGEGWSEAQLVEWESFLAGIDYRRHEEEMVHRAVGDCVEVYRKIRGGKIPGPRPDGTRLSYSFHSPSWNLGYFSGLARKSWATYKPFGLYESAMAFHLESLGRKMDAWHPGDSTEVVRSKIAGFLSPRVVGEIRFDPPVHTLPDSSASRVPFPAPYDRLPKGDPDYSVEQIPVALGRHVVAIARHRLRHGEIPARLEDLAPDLREHLPLNPATAKAPEYLVIAPGRFKLVFGEGRDQSWESPVGR